MLSALRHTLIIPAFFLLLALFIFPQEIQAQGTYRCTWNQLSLPLGSCNGPVTPHNCDPGFQPGHCTEFFPLACGIKDCIPAPPGAGGGTGGSALVGCPAGGKGIDTALGCIPTDDINSFVKWFLSWTIGIGGGIAFLLILWSGFQIMTATGNPDRLKAGKEQLTSAVSGLLFIVFSVFLLKLIGVEILRIPGF